MILFSFPDYKEIADSICARIGAVRGDLLIRNFPEGESYVKINSAVKDQEVLIVCGLDNPDSKIMALMFFAQTAREFGAKKIGLIAPYLGYMRMDKRFNDGEAVTSKIFAEFLSKQIDWLATIDPHLHRYKALEEIYSIPCKTLHADNLVANWIKNNVANPVLIGPDEESEQWVGSIADKASAPFIILTKIRFGDKDVKISAPKIEQYQNHNIVLVDDIIATAGTMIETINHLKKLHQKAPICIGIHALFAGTAYQDLQQAGVKEIITCNTVKHFTNKIDVSEIFAENIFD